MQSKKLLIVFLVHYAKFSFKHLPEVYEVHVHVFGTFTFR